jgi:hypothetical protein
LSISTNLNSNLSNRQIFFRQILSTNLRSTFFIVDKIDVSHKSHSINRIWFLSHPVSLIRLSIAWRPLSRFLQAMITRASTTLIHLVYQIIRMKRSNLVVEVLLLSHNQFQYFHLLLKLFYHWEIVYLIIIDDLSKIYWITILLILFRNI